MKKTIAGIVAAMTITGAAANMGAATADKDIVDTAVGAGSFKTLAKVLQAADLVGTLKGAGPADVVKTSSAKAVSGNTLTIASRDGGVTVDGAKVVKTDIAATNGVIHVIDSVILLKDE
jgi:uncharacterized surface protein with fasciclin (FAS1) repeats